MSLPEGYVPSQQESGKIREDTTARKMQVGARAMGLLDEYRGLPWQATSNRHKAEMFGRDIARDFLRNPHTIDVSVTTWLSGDKSRDKASRQLVADVGAQMTLLQAREEGRHISSQFLSELIRSSVHNPFLKDFALRQLKTLFDLPSNEKESVAAVLKLAEAMIDLYGDREAVTFAASVANHATDIYPYQSQTNANFGVACFGDPYITNPELETDQYHEARIADLIISNISDMLSCPYNSTSKIQGLVSNGTTELITETIHKKNSDFIRRQGIEALVDIIEAKDRYYDVDNSIPPMDDLGDMADPTFIESQRAKNEQRKNYDPDHPVWRKWKERLGSLFTEHNWVEEVRSAYTGELEPFTISIGGKYSATFIVDKSFVPDFKAGMLQDSQFLQSLLYAATGAFEAEDSLAGDILLSTSRSPNSDNGVPTLIRIRSVYEQPSHPAEQLARTGAEELLARTEAMNASSQIQNLNRGQIRFLNTRWVSVPVDRSWLGDLGYESIDFRKDPKDLSKTVARIRANGLSVELRLDENFEIDTEGMAFDHPHLQLALHNILLKILEPILCKNEVRDKDGNKTDLAKLFVSRIGHLRLLLPGHQIGPAQIKAFLEHERKDLLVRNEERQRDLNTTRNSTFVKPKKTEDDPDLAPIVARLPLEVVL